MRFGTAVSMFPQISAKKARLCEAVFSGLPLPKVTSPRRAAQTKVLANNTCHASQKRRRHSRNAGIKRLNCRGFKPARSEQHKDWDRSRGATMGPTTQNQTCEHTDAFRCSLVPTRAPWPPAGTMRHFWNLSEKDVREKQR